MKQILPDRHRRNHRFPARGFRPETGAYLSGTAVLCPDAAGFCRTDTLQLFNIDQHQHAAPSLAGNRRNHSEALRPVRWLRRLPRHGHHGLYRRGAVLSDPEFTKAHCGNRLPEAHRYGDHRRQNQSDGQSAVCLLPPGPRRLHRLRRQSLAGTRGKKERTKSYNAFSSINFPYLAAIQDSHILFYLDGKDTVTEPVRFYSRLNPKVGLLKLIPSMDASVLDYMAGHYDAILIESFGVGGLPTYESGGFYQAVEKWISQGKTIVMTTQVTNEGSNMSIYEVGRSIKYAFGLLEAYDMTLEAAVTKLMWILGQTRQPQQVRQLFYQTVNHDILWKSSSGQENSPQEPFPADQ